MKSLFIYLLLFISLSAAQAQSGWKLIYENDREGNAIFGQIDELIAEIQAGKPLRIYFRMGGETIYVEHTAAVTFTTVMNAPQGKVVTGQIDPIVGQIPSFQTGAVRLKKNLAWSLIASTTGFNDQMTRNVISGDIVEHSIKQWGTKWFVND